MRQCSPYGHLQEDVAAIKDGLREAIDALNNKKGDAPRPSTKAWVQRAKALLAGKRSIDIPVGGTLHLLEMAVADYEALASRHEAKS